MPVVVDSDAVILLRSGNGWGARSVREILPRLALLKAGRGLNTGASVIEIDSGEVQVVLVESRFQARDFGTEPAGEILVGVNRDADLTLLDDGMNLHRAEGVGADAQMHLRVDLGIHLHIGGRIGRDGSGRRRGAARPARSRASGELEEARERAQLRLGAAARMLVERKR